MSKLYSVSYGRSLWQLNRCRALIISTDQETRDRVVEGPIPGRMLKILLSVLAAAVLFTVGILIGHYGIPKSGGVSQPSWVTDLAKDVDESFIEAFLSEVDSNRIQENLR